jgi:hypothetical protein
MEESLTGREMSGTPRGVGAPVARRDEHGASVATSEQREDVRSIEQLGRLRRPLRNGPSRAPLSRHQWRERGGRYWWSAPVRCSAQGCAQELGLARP